MFEKEAEDKAFEKYPLSDRCDKIDFERNLKYEEGFKDGAEFGYNKANEWHYPSKGEYPKEDKRYLCKIKAFVGGGINYECFDYDTEYGSWKNACGDVIAWKEIVLPELPIGVGKNGN